MGFLNDYGMYKAVTGKTKDEKIMGMVLACMDNDSKNKEKTKNNKNSKYDKYGRVIKEGTRRVEKD